MLVRLEPLPLCCHKLCSRQLLLPFMLAFGRGYVGRRPKWEGDNVLSAAAYIRFDLKRDCFENHAVGRYRRASQKFDTQLIAQQQFVLDRETYNSVAQFSGRVGAENQAIQDDSRAASQAREC